MLLALLLAPVSYVAPAREISVLVGVVMGHRLLGKLNVGQRLVATAAVVAGTICATAR